MAKRVIREIFQNLADIIKLLFKTGERTAMKMDHAVSWKENF